MQKLIKIERNNIFTDSLIIATGTNNQHKNVKELINKYKNEFEDLGTFSVSNGESTGGRPQEIYMLNEEQATFLMTLLKNSRKVVLFKKELVKQFYEMRKLLFEKQSAEWIETRKQSKIVRNSLTDVIKELAEYAKGQGSKHSDKLYVTYSKLANKVANIDKRDNASIIQLNMLSTAENIIYKAIVEGIQAGKNYKDIYKESKKRLELFKSIAYIEPSTNNENVLKNSKLLAM